MKTVCVYHSIDLDGWMSAAIVKHWYMSDKSNFNVGERKEDGFLDVNSIEFIGYNYGQPIPDLSEYDKVIMCDISFPKDTMRWLLDKFGKNFIWVDHHISAMIENDGTWSKRALAHVRPSHPDGLRDIKFAACELTWKYFFPNESMPEIVRLLGRYDCFGHKGTDEETKVLEFQYGARSVISNYEEAYGYLISNIKDSRMWIVLSQAGQDIYQYLCTEAQQTYKNGFEIEFKSTLIQARKDNYSVNEIIRYLDTRFYYTIEERIAAAERWLNGDSVKFATKLPKEIGDTIIHKFICINKERFNPINFGIDYHKDGYDGCACFHYADGMWHFSLYNGNGEVDCSVIAKQYGGGGHNGAAGFRCNTETLTQIIINL